jgi:hypothetical protein
MVSNEVKIDLSVFGALVQNRVRGHVDRTDIVAEDNCSAGEGATELLNELAKPTSFSEALAIARYLPSPLERETLCCHLEDHETRLSSRNT